MLLPKTPGLMTLAVVATIIAIGSTDRARFLHIPRMEAAPSAKIDKGALRGQPLRATPVAKLLPRESPLSVFNSLEYGISFRYPRNYALEEGEVAEHSFFLRRQEELDTEPSSAARLIATVLIPDDAYPNTNFLHGSLQVITSTRQTAACGETGFYGDPAEHQIQGLIVNGSRAPGLETTLNTAGTQMIERDYSTSSIDSCYEFSLVVVVRESADDEVKRADVTKIMHQLEKIVSSVQFFISATDSGANARPN